MRQTIKTLVSFTDGSTSEQAFTAETVVDKTSFVRDVLERALQREFAAKGPTLVAAFVVLFGPRIGD